MSEPVIRVENVTKLYRIGKKEQVDTLREALVASFTFPLKNFRRLVNLTRFDDEGQKTGESNDIIYALKDVSFEVQEGERLGIIGRNGAGKSTMLKILSRIIVPTKGRISLLGKVGSLLEVGTGFHPELTGRENIYMNGAVLGMKRREIKAKYDEIVEFSGVEKFLDTPVKRYSSGMFVRLAFAVAAHFEPDILMIDEVLAVGDAEFQKRCLQKLSSITQEGKTVVFVAHDLGTIERLCPRVILLESGRVRMDSDSKTCVAEYMKEFE